MPPRDPKAEMKVGPGSMGHWLNPYKIQAWVNWVQGLILFLTVIIKIIIEWAVDRSTNHSELA